MLEYTRQIDKHSFTIMASHEAQESEWKALSAGRTGFLTNDIFDVNAGNPDFCNEMAVELIHGQWNLILEGLTIIMITVIY
jgi:hypothetical protein